MSTSSIPAVSVQCRSVRLAAATNDRCPDRMHSLLLFIRWDFFFFNFLLHLMHSRYKDKHVLNHKLNSSIAVILLPISKWPLTQKSNPFFYVCSPVSHSERSFYSNLILTEWHEPRSEYHPLTDAHFPFLNKLHFFFLFKTTSTGL